MSPKLRFAVVCSSNMNRSMEAHSFLNKKGYDIESYGTGNMIKIPGESERKPNTYPFGTTYDSIYADLKSKDETLYTKNGMLHIMERNRRIKVSNTDALRTSLRYFLDWAWEISRVFSSVWNHPDRGREGLWSGLGVLCLSGGRIWDPSPRDQHECRWQPRGRDNWSFSSVWTCSTSNQQGSFVVYYWQCFYFV